jgi:hypothetical protein
MQKKNKLPVRRDIAEFEKSALSSCALDQRTFLVMSWVQVTMQPCCTHYTALTLLYCSMHYAGAHRLPLP